MDPRTVNDRRYRDQMTDSLLSLPSVQLDGTPGMSHDVDGIHLQQAGIVGSTGNWIEEIESFC